MVNRTIHIMILCMLGLSPAYAAVECDPKAVTDCASVNSSATGGGAHTSEYDRAPYAANIVGIDSGAYGGQRITYSASLDGLTASSTTGAFFSICGSAQSVVQVQQITASVTTATAIARLPFVIRMTERQTTGGTALSPPLAWVHHNTAYPRPTVSLLNYYSTGANSGAIGDIGAIRTQTVLLPIAVAATDPQEHTVFDFGSREGEAIVLRGPTKCLEALVVGLANAPTLATSVMWTEDFYK